MSRIILAASGKGGAGRTTYAAALANIYAFGGHETLLLDLNPGLRNADIYMGLENDVVFDLADVLSGVCRFDKALVKPDSNPHLSLLCSPQNSIINEAAMSHMAELCELLRRRYEFILIDPPSGIAGNVRFAASSADAAVVIITQDYQALRSGETLAEKLAAWKVKDIFFSVNLVRPDLWNAEELPSLSEMTRCMRVPLCGIVRDDPAVHLANNSGFSIAEDKNSYLFGVFDRMAKTLK